MLVQGHGSETVRKSGRNVCRLATRRVFDVHFSIQFRRNSHIAYAILASSHDGSVILFFFFQLFSMLMYTLSVRNGSGGVV